MQKIAKKDNANAIKRIKSENTFINSVQRYGFNDFGIISAQNNEAEMINATLLNFLETK